MQNAQRGQATGVSLREPIPWHDFVQIVRTAEETGYEACFVPEISGREAFSTLAALAHATDRLHLGTGIVPMHTRRATVTAMGAATVQELSGGRLVLGLGTGPPGPGALERLRSYVVAVRTAVAGLPFTPPDAPGERAELALVPDPAPPIWISALGERSFALAGEIADGVLLNWCTPERVARARDVVADAATRAGRDPAAVTIAVYVRANLADEEPVAIEALKGAAGQYALMPHYRSQLEAMGLGDDAASAARAAASGRPAEVPEALVRELCLVGDPEAARARLDAYRAAGADLPIVYPVPGRDPVSSMMGTVLAAAPSSALEA
ncbi:MAG: LLM class flavin-dependent oxidoreductase [Actinomycetota bacterium]|nr:LLM class flavin-dependent oxidoreductase [Actinomycetota bacterium]